MKLNLANNSALTVEIKGNNLNVFLKCYNTTWSNQFSESFIKKMSLKCGAGLTIFEMYNLLYLMRSVADFPKILSGSKKQIIFDEKRNNLNRAEMEGKLYIVLNKSNDIFFPLPLLKDKIPATNNHLRDYIYSRECDSLFERMRLLDEVTVVKLKSKLYRSFEQLNKELGTMASKCDRLQKELKRKEAQIFLIENTTRGKCMPDTNSISMRNIHSVKNLRPKSNKSSELRYQRSRSRNTSESGSNQTFKSNKNMTNFNYRQNPERNQQNSATPRNCGSSHSSLNFAPSFLIKKKESVEVESLASKINRLQIYLNTLNHL
eukprot:NODE_41_length_34096_cov_2.002235.p11 type:complete len:319 gc:universal NODE_41_length_34096_cov_2.002235:18038-17082(-)